MLCLHHLGGTAGAGAGTEGGGLPKAHHARVTLGETVGGGVGQGPRACWGGLSRLVRAFGPCSHLYYQGDEGT